MEIRFINYSPSLQSSIYQQLSNHCYLSIYLPILYRVISGSLLTAKPRLVEPIYLAEIRLGPIIIMGGSRSFSSLYPILARRRATVMEEKQGLIGGYGKQ